MKYKEYFLLGSDYWWWCNNDDDDDDDDGDILPVTDLFYL